MPKTRHALTSGKDINFGANATHFEFTKITYNLEDAEPNVKFDINLFASNTAANALGDVVEVVRPLSQGDINSFNGKYVNDVKDALNEQL